MSKTIRNIFILVALFSFLPNSMLRAADVLVLEFNSGEKITWETSELPVVTTQENNVLVTTKGKAVSYPINSVLKFYIGDDNPTNVSSLIASKRTISVTDGRIEIRGLQPNEQCRVFKLDGALERQAKADSNGMICFDELSSGIHIINFKAESKKVILP